MRRISYPNIKGFVNFENAEFQGNKILLSLSIFIFNATPLQNEENVSITLSCAQGKFQRSRLVGATFNWVYTSNGRELIYKNFVDILHFGTPYVHKETFEILNLSDEELFMVLTFGGKYSPRKWCSYTLNLKNFNLNDVKGNIIKMEENILFAESATESIDEAIKSYLNR